MDCVTCLPGDPTIQRRGMKGRDGAGKREEWERRSRRGTWTKGVFTRQKSPQRDGRVVHEEKPVGPTSVFQRHEHLSHGWLFVRPTKREALSRDYDATVLYRHGIWFSNYFVKLSDIITFERITRVSFDYLISHLLLLTKQLWQSDIISTGSRMINRTNTLRTFGRYGTSVALSSRAAFFFFYLLSVSGSVEKSTRLGPFEIPKRQGVRRNACEKKSTLLVGQRWCCSFPSSGLRHPCASAPRSPRSRTPTLARSLARWYTWSYVCRVCASHMCP